MILIKFPSWFHHLTLLVFIVDRRHEDLEEEEEIMNITAQAHDQVR